MDTKSRSNIILALAEVVKDIDVIEKINEKSGQFDDLTELVQLERLIMQKVVAYRVNDLWPPEMAPITEVLKFNS